MKMTANEILRMLRDAVAYIENQYGYKKGSSEHWTDGVLTIYLYKSLSTVTLRYFLKYHVIRMSYFSYPSLFESFTVESIKINPSSPNAESLKRFIDRFMMKVFIKRL